jgi:hypothetical protein
MRIPLRVLLGRAGTSSDVFRIDGNVGDISDTARFAKLLELLNALCVLGAGASRHVGYPLASTMGAEMIVWMSVTERMH